MKLNKAIVFLGLMIVGFGCSQEKNTIINRSYHNLTARYNGFFNGRLALQEAHEDMKESYQEEYSQRLPIFIYDNPDVVQPVYPKLERTIEKTSLVVDRHSMDIKGKEYCKWIDDTWMVMGEAQFLKQEFTQAKQIFDFTKMKYPDPEIKQLSYLWLGRIYTAQENYVRAGDQFRKVSLSDGFPEKQLSELHAVKADYFLKQDRLKDAIEELEKSIHHTRKREVKSRRMFILAQLYDEQGDGYESSRLFAEVIKMHPEYEMVFYAKINRALAFDVTAGGINEVKKVLFDMAKDEKNKEYLDQIYYALADLELKQGNEEKGIEYLHLATEKSVRNGNAKGLAYYKLADIYFEKPNYELAQSYYDSTVAFLSTEHPDYEMVLARANSLTQMMRDINTVDEQDSLQAFVKLPKKEQEHIIEMKIEDFIQAEKDAERQRELEELRGQQAKSEQSNQFNQNAVSGGWYFYNPGAVGFGEAEFKRIWGGNRKNEDNWRRSDKTSSAPLLLEDEETVLAEDTLDGANDPKNPNYYWKTVPDTEEKMERSHALIIEALYDLALVYKEQMKDLPPAAETFEDLLSRYDSSKYHAVSNYQLYLIYSDLNNSSKADYFKQVVMTKYPDSDYAQVILNPNFAAKEAEATKAVQEAYEEAYSYFEQGFYRKAYELITITLEEYPKSEFLPQCEMLRAICLGYIDGSERMIDELKAVSKTYGGSDVGKEAKEMVDYFENGREIDSGVEEAMVEMEEQEAERAMKKFTYDLGASHNFILIIPDTLDGNEVQNQVSDFNRKYFSTKGFKTSKIPLNEGSTMVVVSNIGYASKAMDYYGTFKNAAELKDLVEAGYPRYVISYDNYAHFFKDQNIVAYEAFFEENYAKKK
ncbi:MAG: tetratricopeptide repeat protein [Salibacteraceae bacterium]